MKIRSRIKMIRLRPGDRLVVSCGYQLSRENKERIITRVNKWAPGVDVLVLDGGMQLSRARFKRYKTGETK